MPMSIRIVNRATAPHLPTLADTLRPLLAAANSGAFHLRWQDGMLSIEQTSFTGVNLALVDAAVTNAPVYSEALDVKAQINNLPLLQKVITLTTIDAINVERARHGVGEITPVQAIANIVAKVDTL